MARVLIALIRIYQLTLSRVLTAILGPVCRFTPSCSAYALECVRIHGAARGTLLSVRRLTKCHPFHPGGYDPPPPPRPSGKGGLLRAQASENTNPEPTPPVFGAPPQPPRHPSQQGDSLQQPGPATTHLDAG
jgi:hypothetical protein